MNDRVLRSTTCGTPEEDTRYLGIVTSTCMELKMTGYLLDYVIRMSL